MEKWSGFYLGIGWKRKIANNKKIFLNTRSVEKNKMTLEEQKQERKVVYLFELLLS